MTGRSSLVTNSGQVKEGSMDERSKLAHSRSQCVSMNTRHVSADLWNLNPKENTSDKDERGGGTRQEHGRTRRKARR